MPKRPSSLRPRRLFVVARRTPTSPAPPAPLGGSRIVAAMLRYSPARVLDGRKVERQTLVNRWKPKGFRMRLSASEEATAWLFGVFFDHMIRAEAAWAAPFELAKRIGHLDVRRIAEMPLAELASALAGGAHQKALHRLHRRLAGNLHAASKRIVAEYDGDVEAIWPDGLPVPELRTRLESFSGLGQKLVHMAMNILVQDFGRNFRGWNKVDVAVDRHVARVFLRTGLVSPKSVSSQPSVGELRTEAISAARRLVPMYPAALDYPAYEVGRQWCRAGAPDCGTCPLRSACPQNRRSWQVS